MSLHDRSGIQGYVIGVTEVRPLDPTFVVVNRLAEGWSLIRPDHGPSVPSTPRANGVPAVDDWRSITSPFDPNRVRWNLRREHAWRGGFVDVVVELEWRFGAPYRGGGAFIPELQVRVLSAESTASSTVDLACTVTHPRNVGSVGAPIASLTVSVLGRVRVHDADETVGWSLTVRGDGETAAPDREDVLVPR